jgi:20S proteasome alpha/beta subunit
MLKLKPRPFPMIEMKRFTERKPVTIALGFASLPGVILCSDTQMTSDSGFKFEESKMLCAMEGPWSALGTYAGSPTMAKAVERQLGEYCYGLLESQSDEPTLGQFEKQLQRVVSRVCSKHRGPLQMLWALSLKEHVHLLKIDQKTINDVSDCACLGLGDSSLVRFLLENLYIVRTQDAVRTSAYIVRQAMKYVDGVGGKVEIYAIYRGGRWKRIKTNKLPSFKRLVSETSEQHL